jgi:hypothetical protein
MAARKATEAQRRRGRRLTHDHVVALVGDLGDAGVAEILAIGATAGDLNEAIAWAEEESDVMGKLGKRLGGRAAKIYDILMTRRPLGPES